MSREIDFSCDAATFRNTAEWQALDGAELENGTKRTVRNQQFIYFDGYWIRYYQPPSDTLEARKNLIDP